MWWLATCSRLPGAGLPKVGFLDLEDSWKAILGAHDAEPSQFTIICYGEEYGYDIVGSGNTVLRLFNEGGDHFVPLWPVQTGGQGHSSGGAPGPRSRGPSAAAPAPRGSPRPRSRGSGVL
jgi:hypothetical protein